MRKVIFAINITLDGCCDHTKMIADDEVHDYFTGLLSDVDLLVFGRKTYELMVPFWPDVAKTHSQNAAMNRFADAFNSISRLVFSRTLHSVEEDNTRRVHDGLGEDISKLKKQSGKAILLGGVALPSQLMELGLVDEFRFVVQPILAGPGARLLEGIHLENRWQLKLVDSKVFRTGCVALRYRKQ